MAPPRASSEGLLATSSDDGEKEGPLRVLTSDFDASSAPEHQLTRSPIFDNHSHSPSSPITPRSTSHIAPRGLHKGGIAGIVVGAIVVVSLFCVCLWPFLIRFRKTRKRQSSPTSDPETAIVPQDLAHPTHGPPTRSSSRESLSHKDDDLQQGNGVAPRSSRDADPAEQPTSPVDSPALDRGAPMEHTLERNHSRTSRHSAISTGQTPKWNTEGPPPLSPGGIELVATRADGFVYSEAVGGQSASYYSPEETFGMTTPPPTDERGPAVGRRSSSRASSLKYNLMSLMRRMSSKDTATQAPSPTTEGFTTPPTRAVPGFQQHGTFGDYVSESPVTQTGPSFQDFGYASGRSPPPQLASPVPLPMSPVSTPGASFEGEDSKSRAIPRIPEKPEQSPPPVFPPSSPAPGTVNPMDVMAPSNQSEQAWNTDQQLYFIAHPEASPSHSRSPPPQQAHASQGATPRPPIEEEDEEDEEEQDEPVQVKQEPTSNGFSPNPAPPAHLSQDTKMTEQPYTAAAEPYVDYSHLMPATAQPGPPSFDGNWTEPTDHSTPMPSQGSSMPSTHNTPNTQLTEISPSPRSEPYSDVRNSASPYNGSAGSPGTYACEQCGRGFDQVHKLNHHKRYHDRPHKCGHKGCDKQFGTKTHLDRHINDKHNKTRKYHCLEPTCPYSRTGGKAFPRKDNWRRHMINKHGMSPQADPEPDLADEAMTGM